MIGILIQKIVSLAIILAIGFALLRWGPFTEADSRTLSKLTVNLVMPCSIFAAFQMERTPEVVQGLLLVLLAAVVLHLLMLLVIGLIRRPLGLGPVEQASILYTNAGNLIIPLVSAMLGPRWVIYTSAYILVQNLLTWSHGKNLICQGQGVDLRKMFLNPNIIALMAGCLLFFLNWKLPPLLGETISTLGGMVGPVAMLVTGMLLGTLPLGKTLRNYRIWMVSGLRLLCFPLICLGALALINLVFPSAPPYLLVSMLAASSPTASVITLIAQLSDRDPGYASSICVITTILCVVTIPLMLSLYMAIYRL